MALASYLEYTHTNMYDKPIDMAEGLPKQKRSEVPSGKLEIRLQIDSTNERLNYVDKLRQAAIEAIKQGTPLEVINGPSR